MSRIVSPAYFVIEGDGGSNTPKRPTLDQLSGANFSNCVAPYQAPIPDEEPLAEDWNQLAFTVWALSQMMPVLIVGITGGASPALNKVIAPNRNIDQTVPTNANVSVAHQGTGHYRVTIGSASTLLPQISWPPQAFANKTGSCAASAAWVSAGVYDIYLSDNTGAIEANCSLAISGY